MLYLETTVTLFAFSTKATKSITIGFGEFLELIAP
jgi:hypothetical protein